MYILNLSYSEIIHYAFLETLFDFFPNFEYTTSSPIAVPNPDAAPTNRGMKYSNVAPQLDVCHVAPTNVEPYPPAAQIIGPPHIGTLSTTPTVVASAPPTNPATMNEGIHFLGSLAANGIEPSVIPNSPINDADQPAVISCSSILIGVNF